MAQDTELGGHVLGGKYRLVRQVSDGPRRVYEARHERLAGRFAAKLWPATTPWEAFRRGAEVAATLRHPGVMQVLDFNCEPGASPFLVYEWIDGARLSDVIAEAGILPLERVAPLIESAAWALASAHQQGVVHQELRPDEVFVVHAPGTMREWVKVAGFGVTAALARAGTMPPSRYRAPEQGTRAPGDDDDDPQSDQYSLAAIAYEMLAGVPPFDEERSRAEPLPISDLAPGVSPAVDAAIRQALATEPELRFPGVLEFARALRAAADGASPESVRRRAETRAERGRRDGETISPFFNPLQGRATEVFRRVATSTARLRTLARAQMNGGALLPARPRARAVLAGGALLLAFAGVAALVRRPTPPHVTATAPSKVAPPQASVSPPVPTTPVATAPGEAAPGEAAPGEAPSQAATPTAGTTTSAPGVAVAGAPAVASPTVADAPAKDPRAAAWARLATGSGHATGASRRLAAPKAAPTRPTAAAKTATGPKVASAGKPMIRAKPSAVVAKAAAPAAASAAPKTGACVMSVGSRPPADVWIDEHSTGRRTPLVKYRVACGDHKLALKRADLDIYQMEIVTLREGAPFKKVYPLQ